MGVRGQDLAKGHVLHVLRKTPAVRMKPPADLDLKAKRLWKRIVEAYPASHFKPGDDVLLKRFCEAAITIDKEIALLAEEGNIISTDKGNLVMNPRRVLIQMLTNGMSQSSTKLRMCPSTRLKRAMDEQEENSDADEKRNARAGLMFGG